MAARAANIASRNAPDMQGGPPSGSRRGSRRGEDTLLLLRTGGGCWAVGLLAALLMLTVFGGVSRQGPHTNSGWLALMVAMMCLPFGTILLTLGFAKWVGHRKGSGRDSMAS